MWSFFSAFSPFYLLICTVGTILGIVWGAMPGLSTTMAMALLVGISFGMSPEVAICFMLGVFTGSVFGGAITAVLINIPGTPGAVPTQLAGFPLAKKGQGGLALGMAITGSMVGNWAGILVLVAAAPYVMEAALKFASWELGLLMLWGVAISGTMTAGERPLKGWISGWLGLMIAMVGRELMYGQERFTFGVLELESGFPWIPIMIGLFGIAEIFDGISEPTPFALPQKVGKVFPPFGMMLKYWKAIFRSSFFGILTGVIPGCGASVASFVAYSMGERFSKKDFSKGDLEGVLCSEVSNNANIGGAMLPSLVLGIPGSAPTALFIAAMSLHGIVLGPTIENEQPGMLNFIYATLIVANVAMYVGGYALLKPSVKLFSQPKELLLPLIGVICVVGSFAEQMSMFDIYLMFGFGILGYLMRLTGFPAAPMIMGIILGAKMDENLRRSMVVFAGDITGQLMSRPIGLVLVLIVILTFIHGIFGKRILSEGKE